MKLTRVLQSSAALTLALGWAAGAAHAVEASSQSPGAWTPLLLAAGAPAWRGWISSGLPTGWRVADGVLSKDGAVEDLVSREMYGNFELKLEWKIGKGGNSGIFYRGNHEYSQIYWSAPEYQLLDDANHPDGRDRLTAAGSAYGLYGVPAGVVKPFGEWNESRLILKGSHVEHWLNGERVVSYELGSPEWAEKVSQSKFAAYPHYGLAKEGYLGIQGDHTGSLSIRNMLIRSLP